MSARVQKGGFMVETRRQDILVSVFYLKHYNRLSVRPSRRAPAMFPPRF